MIEKISVIIPTFNAAETIDRTLNSLFGQSVLPFEVIIVDDGSTDDTVSRLTAYKNKIVLFCQKNLGAAAARNQGVKLAAGDLIAFLDADDVWHPQKLELQLSVFNDNEKIGICSTLYSKHIDDGKKNFESLQDTKIISIDREQKTFEDVFLNPYLGTPTVVIRKAIFNMIGGFDESLQTAEDIDLWIRACHITSHINVKHILCYVMVQKKSLSTIAKISPFESHLNVIDKFCTANKDFYAANKNLVRSTMALIYTHWGSSLLSNREFEKAQTKLTNSLKLKPSVRGTYLYVKALLKK